MASRPKPPQSETGVVVAVSAGVFRIDGRLQRYHAGQTFPQGHALVRLRPEAFRAVEFRDSAEPRRGA